MFYFLALLGHGLEHWQEARERPAQHAPDQDDSCAMCGMLVFAGSAIASPAPPVEADFHAIDVVNYVLGTPRSRLATDVASSASHGARAPPFAA